MFEHLTSGETHLKIKQVTATHLAGQESLLADKHDDILKGRKKRCDRAVDSKHPLKVMSK